MGHLPPLESTTDSPDAQAWAQNRESEWSTVGGKDGIGEGRMTN